MDNETLEMKETTVEQVAEEPPKKEGKGKKEKKKGGKTWRIVLLSVLLVIVAIACVITMFARKNCKEMDAVIAETISEISKGHRITKVDAGEYSEMKAYGIMKFHIKQYEIEDVGNLSVMSVNAGVMQMATVVFSPFEKDLPLMSCDYMYMLSTRKAYVEFYDLVKEKDETYLSWMKKYQEVADRYADLKDCTASSGWYDSLITLAVYKQTGPKQDEQIRALLKDEVKVYLDQADAYPLLSDTEKAAKVQRIKEYSDRLIDEGGVSTSFFKQALGEDVTRDFFDKVFFGTEQAK